MVRYVQLAHNFRDPETRKPQAQVLWSFGREEEVDKDSLRRLVDSINRFLGPEDVLQQQAKVGDAPLLFKESLLGGAGVLNALWCELGIDRAIGKVIKDRAFRTPVERAIFAMGPGWNEMSPSPVWKASQCSSSTGPWTSSWKPATPCRKRSSSPWPIS